MTAASVGMADSLGRPSAGPLHTKQKRQPIPQAEQQDHARDREARREPGRIRRLADGHMHIAGQAKRQGCGRGKDEAGADRKKRADVLTSEGDAMQGSRGHQEDDRERDATQRRHMNKLWRGRQVAESSGEGHDQLKAEQRLGTGNDNPRLGKHLVDTGNPASPKKIPPTIAATDGPYTCSNTI
jgi:hypothetical protein